MLESFLKPEEEELIIESIRKAERKTSGEIRIHLECHQDKEAYPRAYELFHLLKMDNTRLRNGVLIYLAVEDHKFAIYGDKGIHDKVKFEFWNKTRDLLQHYFTNGEFSEGLIKCVEIIGEELSKHFPWSPFDENEISNEISKG